MNIPKALIRGKRVHKNKSKRKAYKAERKQLHNVYKLSQAKLESA